MGTSQSSKGPGAKVPLVPVWVPSTGSLGDGAGEGVSGEGALEEETLNPPLNVEGPEQILTPERGFSSAKRSLGKFAVTGDSSKMRQSLGHYVHTSYKGSNNAVNRHGGSIKNAISLYDVLSSATPTSIDSSSGSIDVEGKSAREILNSIVEVVRPVDGTQDSEASRASVANALSELLERFPDADLLKLTQEERVFAVERYLTEDIFCRFNLDLGNVILEKALNPTEALSRLKEIRDYIRETVSASFRPHFSSGNQVTSSSIGRIIKSALKQTFEIFESYTV